MSAGDEAAGKVNNILSVIAIDLVPEEVMPYWKEMKRNLSRDEGAEYMGMQRNCMSVWTE